MCNLLDNCFAHPQPRSHLKLPYSAVKAIACNLNDGEWYFYIHVIFGRNMAISNLGSMLLKEEIKTVETEVVEEEVSA